MKSWDKWANLSVITITIANALYVYCWSDGWDNVEKEEDFNEYLFENMIDNDNGNPQEVPDIDNPQQVTKA